MDSVSEDIITPPQWIVSALFTWVNATIRQQKHNIDTGLIKKIVLDPGGIVSTDLLVKMDLKSMRSIDARQEEQVSCSIRDRVNEADADSVRDEVNFLCQTKPSFDILTTTEITRQVKHPLVSYIHILTPIVTRQEGHTRHEMMNVTWICGKIDIPNEEIFSASPKLFFIDISKQNILTIMERDIRSVKTIHLIGKLAREVSSDKTTRCRQKKQRQIRLCISSHHGITR